jgi:energy-coupling factor transport system ATP-binding protein
VIAEHRVERVLKYADSVISVHRDGSVTHQRTKEANLDSGHETTQRVSTATDEITFSAKSLQQTYKDLVALSPTDLDLRAGSVTGVAGANGAGKSSLLWAIVEDAWRQKLPIAMVPQNATDLLFLNSVSAELAEADRFAQQPPNSAATILESLIGRMDPKLHPRDLSCGQQLALAVSVQLIRETSIVLLDEPTRGLDAAAKSELASLIDRLASRGISVVIATHDQNFLNRISDQIITLELGRVVTVSD